jgi:hypothetical protein
MPHDELIERLLATRSIQHTVSARDDDDPVPRVPINPDNARSRSPHHNASEGGYPNKGAETICALIKFDEDDDEERHMRSSGCSIKDYRRAAEALGTSGLVER